MTTTSIEFAHTLNLPAQSMANMLLEAGADGPATLVTTFECNGTVVTVTTTQNPGETFQDFVDRHKARVEQAHIDGGC
ncbi:MAG: hypothetical protein H6830_04605 [Planctomycetes bacterium]|nr:hypothetical protein [Planctomycetota bacterium]MCB9910525.1 hypothetical protein [Planctomycetota bacterium]MCB9912651.1 hypothetical protein [Planctomycetota bacterium]HPF15348.1 hypothetical protein [Planctomycetota bacterium]